MMYTLYLIVMLLVVLLVALIGAPSLFWPKCGNCERRNWVEREVCGYCGAPLPDDLQ